MQGQPDILCIGAVLWDIIGRSSVAMTVGADVPGRITRVPGGVALNVARTLAGLGLRAAVLSAIGRDRAGDDLIASVTALGIDCSHVYRSETLPTDIYMAIEAEGRLIAAIADAHSLEAAMDRILQPVTDGQLGAPGRYWRGPVALDGNLSASLLAEIARLPAFSTADLRVAPASPGKAERLLPLLRHPHATIYLNVEEAGILCGTDFPSAPVAAQALRKLGARHVLVTDGAADCAALSDQGILTATPYRVPVLRVTGAGDTFMAAHIAAELRGDTPVAALTHAMNAAAQFISSTPD